jgi:uncharacterized protein (TIGR02611 family)
MTEQHPRVEKLRQRKERHKQRPRLVRVLVAVGGFATVAGGIALLVLPGPGIPLLVVGLGLLALEFDWAEAAFVRTLEKAEQAARLAGRRGRKAKVFGIGASLMLAAAIAAAFAVWGLPGLPF